MIYETLSDRFAWSEQCPRPMCCHVSHFGAHVPRKYCGASVRNGQVIHHVRCLLNPSHHQMYVRMGGRWYRLKR
jgi:hypothetical protein